MLAKFRYLYQNSESQTRKRVWLYALISLLGPIINLFGISAILPILNNIMNKTAGKGDMLLAFVMGFVMIASGIFDLFSNRISSRLTHEGSHRLSLKLYELTLREDLLQHNNRDAMQALALIRTDSLKCMELMKAFVTSAVSMMMLLAFFVFLVCLDGVAGIVIAVFVCVQMLLLYLSNRRKIRIYGERIREADIQVNGQVTTAYGAYKELRCEDDPDNFLKRYEQKSMDSVFLKTEYANRNAMVGVIMKNGIYTVMFFALAFVMFLQLDMTAYISKIVVTAMLVIRILPLGNMLVNSVNAMKSGEKSYDCVRTALGSRLMLTEAQYKLQERREKSIALEKGIFIRDLCFSYPDGKMIFNHADMDIPTGKSVAIIGQSGAGKTTFLDLMLGLMKPQSGKILYDDYDSVAMCDEEGPCIAHIGRVVSYIPQLVFMNGSTVRENVAFFQREGKVDEERVHKCLQDACILEDVLQMPEGIDTLIGARGIAISGGQRQRIALARALYKEFEILIMDEATAALDSDTEKAVMDSIAKVRGKKTLLMVTHHDAIAKQCDIVYRVIDGKIVRER